MNLGLSSQEAALRLEQYGKNELPREEKASLFKLFLAQFQNLIVWVLIAASAISFFVADWVNGTVILSIMVLNALLGFIQEWKSVRSIEELTEIEKHYSKVIRDETLRKILTDEIVPGDLVLIEAGDLVPADGTLVQALNFSVNEATLTGESLPVYKSTESKNLIFRGTTVTTGKGQFLVTATGVQTEVGQIAALLEGIEEKQTPLQKRLDLIGKKLVFFCVGIILLIFTVGFFEGFPLYSLLMTSLSLAVAAIPEGLPAVMTIALAIGVRRMVKKNALVRKLTAVETLGCTSVICTDKTGTLTENRMQVENAFGNEHLLFDIASVCNGASLEAGDPIEMALLKEARKRGVLKTGAVLDEIPFDSDRKLMSVLVEKPEGLFVYTKGAPDVLLKKSKNGSAAFEEKIIGYSKGGLKVLGFGYKRVHKKEITEEDFEFVGLIALKDPLRAGVKETLQSCQDAQMKVIMLTGDHKETAVAIGKEAGLIGEALDAQEIDSLSDDALSRRLTHTSILARISAKHKMRVVDLLQKKGEIVAMTGDGVNDAPAVEKADIGISMGISGTDVTKSASDLILLDDQFKTIVVAVQEGRLVYDNIIKFTSYLFSCNLAEILIVFSSLFFLDKSALILAPIHLLWINIVTDGLPAIALALDPLSPTSMKSAPRKQDAPLFSKSWLFTLVGLSLVISALTVSIFLITLPLGLDLARTCAFTALVFFELSKPFLLRIPYQMGLSNFWLIGAVLLSLLSQIAVVYLPFLHLPFETVSMSAANWAWILLGALVLWAIGYPLMRWEKKKSH
jgi:Ca2+-transporting ATPase